MKRALRNLSILNKSNRTGLNSITRNLSTQTQEKNEGESQEDERVIQIVPKEKKIPEISIPEIKSVDTTRESKKKSVLTLKKKSELLTSFFPEERTFNGYIQPRHYKLLEPQLISEFSNELEKIAVPILQLEPPVIDIVLGTNKLKFLTLKASIQHFGREIPTSEIQKIKTVRDIAVYFAKQVIAEVPPPEFNIPNNVSLFIKEHEKKREILVREQLVKLIGERKRKSVLKQIKNYFPGPTPNLTEEEVDLYLRVFRRNADDKIFKKKLIKKHNPRKLYDTRIDYDRPGSAETEEVFKKKFEEQA